ncbi:Triacylglycerol lipase 2 [Nymphaea thermarum]|nr:Triacylglycerol lipase 2 [Nymphaea thermarum]
MQDGMVWVLSKQGLALALSDAGFEAWIVHSRGTKSSRRHTSLNADTNQSYWAWTWVEFAEFDIPATVDFIYNATGQRVHLVGHSLGALTILASLSQGKLVDKTGAVALLAPVAYMRHVTSPLLLYGANFYADKFEFDAVVRSGKIAKHDYGNASTNNQMYGQSTPPVYDLSTVPVDVPLFISRGEADALTDVQDFNSLVSSLGNHQQSKLTVHSIPEYAHADFLMGSNTGEMLHPPLIAFLSNSTN